MSAKAQSSKRSGSKGAASESSGGVVDLLRWLLAIFLLLGAVAGFYLFAEYSLLLRVLGLLAIVGVATAVVWSTGMGQNTRYFMRESKIEVRKVVWPSGAETKQTTLMVFVAVIAVGIFLWLVDMFFLWAVALVTGQGA